MRISIIKIVWFFISLIFSGFIACDAYINPLKYLATTDLLATIFSVLVGISLAITALLTSPNLRSLNLSKNEKIRVKNVIKKDDSNIIFGQTFVFWCYYVSLILAVAFKIMTYDINSVGEITRIIQVLSSVFVLIAGFSLLWSATLPSLFSSIREQRDNLN